MATKIKRSLFIGMGGTGMKTLVNTKRMFIETYGEVPPMIGFLGIDTDRGEYKKDTTKNKNNEAVILSPDETLPITVENAKEIYHVNAPEGHMTWIPEKNIYALTSMTQGAGQIRTNGRFALTMNYHELKNKVVAAINKITQARISTNPKYELLSSDIEIHMVFSVCGGTGAGTFINMAYLLKEVAPQCKLTGYGVLPDVFEAMSNSGMAKVKANAYAAIQDLDWLMHLDGTKKITLDYITEEPSFDTKPFNAFFFLDNKNVNNDTYTDVAEITELLSLALVTSAGELGTASASVIDNLEKNIMEGDMNVEDKRAWISGLGVCEIVFRGSTLQEIYALKGTKRLIENLLNSCEDSDVIASNWIDLPSVNIRENNNKDNVLNFLLDKSPRHQLIEIDDKANAKAEIDMWLKNDAVKLSDIQKQLDLKVAQLRERVEAELQQLIVKQLNRDFGVGGTLSVLNAIKSNINVFAEEIGEELEILNSRTIAARENTMKIAIQDLTEYNGKFFKLKSHLIELTEGAIQAATQLAEQQRDALRHESAIQFYNGMKQLLQDAIDHVEAIRRQLLTVNANVQTRLSELQNYVGRNPRTFQIDLALDTNVTVKDDELNMNALIQSIGLPNGIYDFSERKPEEIEPFFVDYCMGLNSAKELGDRSIDDIINEMSDEEFDSLLTMAIKKSEPLFRFDYHGHAPKERPTNSFYVGVLNRDDSRLKRGNAFKLKLPGNPDVDFASIGQKDRIIIYRQRGVVPAYALTGIPTYRVRYENCTNCDCHFDADIEQRMRREGYTLEPSTKNDDTLEFWVKGLIFGLIKNEDGCYYVKNEDNDSLALNDYWESLGAYRDDAYKAFKQRLPLVADSFEKFFNNYQNSVGNDAIQRIINDVKLEQNYLQKYSQIGMPVEEIQKKGNESLKKLIVEEINYVKKEL